MDIEKAVLRAMCQEGGEVLAEGLRRLDHHRFSDIAGQVVFEALRRMGSGRPDVIREQLQRQLVLAGFPGLSASEYFEPHGLSREEALALMDRLGTRA